jgi:hypothetical protein
VLFGSASFLKEFKAENKKIEYTIKPSTLKPQ